MAHHRREHRAVVVIIGSGAGGGTVANELTQRGRPRAWCWRPAPHLTTRTTSTTSGRRSARWPGWTPRTTIGQLAGRPGLPEPAGLDRQGGRRHDHALVRRHPAVQRARVQDPDALRRHRRRQPARLADHPGRPGAVLRPGRERRSARTHRARPAAAAGEQQLQGVRERRRADRLQVLRHRPVRHQRRTVRRPARRRSRTASTSRATRTPPSGAPLVREIPRALATGNLRPAAESQAVQITHDAQRPGRRRAVPGRATATCTGRRAQGGLRRRQLDRDAAAAADERQRAAPGRAGELLRPGRPQLHAAHDRLGVRAVRQAGAHVPRRDDGRASSPTSPGTTPSRGFAGGYYMETLSLGPCRSWPRSSSRAPGAGVHRDHGRLREHRRDVDRRRGHAAGDEPGHAERAVTDKHGLPVPNVHFDDHPNDVAMREPRLRRRPTCCTRRSARPACTTRRRTRPRTTWAPAG